MMPKMFTTIFINIDFQEVPGMLTSFLDTLYDWRYKLKEQRDKISGVFNDRVMKYPRGKSLGGTG